MIQEKHLLLQALTCSVVATGVFFLFSFFTGCCSCLFYCTTAISALRIFLNPILFSFVYFLPLSWPLQFYGFLFLKFKYLKFIIIHTYLLCAFIIVLFPLQLFLNIYIFFIYLYLTLLFQSFFFSFSSFHSWVSFVFNVLFPKGNCFYLFSVCPLVTFCFNWLILFCFVSCLFMLYLLFFELFGFVYVCICVCVFHYFCYYLPELGISATCLGSFTLCFALVCLL